jgi:tetratricopeptide (TPR) repeat protein
MAPGLAALGCTSASLQTMRGARHYSAGTEALTRNESALAVAELERAAVLVPHASEIQNHLGLAYWADGRLDEAGFAFERAVELDCENLAAAANLSRLRRASRHAVDETAALGVGVAVVETAESGADVAVGETAASSVDVAVEGVVDETDRGG